MRRTLVFLAPLAVATSLLGGCAPQAIIVKPGPVPTSGAPVAAPQGQPWSIWVAEARDARVPEQAGNRIGTFYTRFTKKPQAGYLEPNPDVYLRQQLSRYLLSKGWEASSRENARALLKLEVEDFSMAEDPGAVWDSLNVKVVYVVRVEDLSGREIGKVRLEGGSQIKTPGDAPAQVESAFRSAVADTFDALTRSDAFRRALGATGR